jgi:hypothetical protein
MAISDLLHDTILAAKLPVQYKVVCGEHTGIDNDYYARYGIGAIS